MPITDPRSDEALIDAINGGDVAAFEALYHRYRDWVVRLAHRITGSSDLALDVLQETFTYLLGKVPGFRLTAKMTTFLYPVVKNLSIAARRKAGRFAGDPEALDAAAAKAPPGGASRAELAAAISALPDERREVVLMRFVDGMTLEEVAGALGIPLGTVKSRLHNALAALRDDPRARRFFAP